MSRKFMVRLKTALRHQSRLYYNIITPVYALYRNGKLNRFRRKYGFDNNAACFAAYNCKSYCDSPRLVSEELHRMRPDAKITWLFNDVEAAKKKFDIPDYVECRYALSDEGLRALACSRILVDNFSKSHYLKIAFPKQVYLQVWHGDRAFKKIGLDTKTPRNYLLEQDCSMVVVGSDYGEMQFRSAFRYKGEFLRVGCPRNDILLRNDPAEADAIRAKLGIEDDVCCLVYAPTFRDRASLKRDKQRMPLDLSRVLDTLERVSGKKWICLLRTHYLSFGIREDGADKRIRNVTAHPEMMELLKIGDALISDYSSCAGDFALTGRPVYLYQDDLEDYANNDRELYFDMKDSPYWVATNPDELDALIEKCTSEAAKENCKAILDFYNTDESGRAAEAVAEYLVKKMDEAKGEEK